MNTLFLDLEADGLSPTKVWCVVCLVRYNGEPEYIATFSSPVGVGPDFEGLQELCRQADAIVAHNGIAFDFPVLRELLGIEVPQAKAIDTLVMSRLLTDRHAHSLGSWGETLGYSKGDFNDWSHFSKEMLDYCIRDVVLLSKIYDNLNSLVDDQAKVALGVEHKIQHICRDMKDNGFPFNYSEASCIRKEVGDQVDQLLANMQEAFPPVIEQRPRSTKVIPFNPASPKQVIDRMWDCGWQPTERTTGSLKNEDKAKKERYDRYGWKVSEVNLATLPDDAPPAARDLVKYLLLIARVRKLDEWMGLYEPKTSCIHGDFNGIGTWTHRMSHSRPNMGNVSAEKSIKYKTEELNSLATELGGRMRSLWVCPQDSWLVGTDAEGIQLRILAHYINDPEFTKALVNGKKEDKTDIHSFNQQRLGSVCKTRDNAKTFIYAFLLGAGIAKIAEIFGCTRREAERARDQFIAAIPGLRHVKEKLVPADAKRGFFVGLDGRKVHCTSEHLMLAGYLQTGEAVVMKHANLLWRRRCENYGLRYKQVNFVHDEWQTISLSSSKKVAELLGQIQADSIRDTGLALKLNCPLAGSFSVGKNWLETH